MDENCEKRFIEKDNLEEILEDGNYEKAKITEEVGKIIVNSLQLALEYYTFENRI